MIAGLKLHTAIHDNRDRAGAWLGHCNANQVPTGLGCQIGQGKDAATEISKTIMPPMTIRYFEDLTKDKADRKNSDTGKLPVNTGFQAHLQVIGQLAYGAAYGGISKNGVKLLKDQADRQPWNALYVGAKALYTDGNMADAAGILFSMCPKDRLPTTADYCTDYLYQRDRDNKDWQACPPVKTHEGTDCAFAAAVILGEVR